MSDTSKEILVSEQQREAERSALRKVRGVLDKVGEEELAARRLRRRIFIIIAVVAVPLVFVLAGILAKSKELQGPPLVLPQLQQKQ